MEEKKKTSYTPAQARLLKLKEELKEKNKKKLAEAGLKARNDLNKVSPEKSTTRISSRKGNQLKKELQQKKTPSRKINTQVDKKKSSIPKKEAPKPLVSMKRKISDSSEGSPCKLRNNSGSTFTEAKTALIPTEEVSIATRIKQNVFSLCGKLTSFSRRSLKGKYVIPKKTSVNQSGGVLCNVLFNKSETRNDACRDNFDGYDQSFTSVHQSEPNQKIENTSGECSNIIKTNTAVPESVKRNLFKRNPSTSSSEKISELNMHNHVENSRASTFKDNNKLFTKNLYGHRNQSKSNCCKNQTVNEKEFFSTNVSSNKQLSSNCEAQQNVSSYYNLDIVDDGLQMEWEPIKEHLLRSTRNEIDAKEEMMDWQDGIECTRNELISEKGEKCVYFVVDTNVLIQNISLIKKLAEIDIRGYAIILMIPWQVLKELDKLKCINDKCVAGRARGASRFLSECQNNRNNIIFQKQSEHFKDCRQVLVEVPDDHLIKACCQLKNQNKKVVLLSNDTNLRIKGTAIGSFPSVSDSWVSKLLENVSKSPNFTLHCFETPPADSLEQARMICAIYLHKLTICLNTFLFSLVRDILKRKYDELWIFWIPNFDMPLDSNLKFIQTLSELNPFKSQLDYILKFYKGKQSYMDIKATDVEQLGRYCVAFAESIHNLCPEIGLQFDKNIGFLKTGNLEESCYGYTAACCAIAQSHFKKMEDKLNLMLNRCSQLISGISSQRIFISDVSKLLSDIDNHVIVTNEASSVILLLSKDEEISLPCPEVKIFYKVLLNFLEINFDEFSLPLLSDEDIIMYVNQERSNLYPAALNWLSNVRRQFFEFKSILRKH